jgi:Fe-S-cluster containining protein
MNDTPDHTAHSGRLFNPVSEGGEVSSDETLLGLSTLFHWLNTLSTKVWAEASPDDSKLRRFLTLRQEIIEHLEKEVAQFTATEANAIVCSKGCSACCYTRVEIKVLDAIAIAQSLALTLTAKECADLQIRCEQQAKYTAQMSRNEKFQKQVACPFLKGDLCSIYDIRPLTCRSYFSTNREICDTGQPGHVRLDWGLSIAIEKLTTATGAGHLYQTGELAAMLAVALKPGTFEKLDRGETPFPTDTALR